MAVGEKFDAGADGDNVGEQALSPEERAAMEQEAGRKVIDAANSTEGQRIGDKVEWTPENLRKFFGKIQDKSGQPYFSKETIDRLVDRGEAVDPVQEEQDAAIKKAQDAAYKAAQMEIARTLNGRSINKYLTDSHRDLVKLQGEIKRLSESIYNDPLLKKMQQRLLADAEGELLSMNRRRKMIENLKNGEQAEPVGSEEYGDFNAVNAELEMNQPETVTAVKMDLAAFDRILPMFKNDPEVAAKLLRAREKYVKAAEAEDEEAEFASTETGETTDEEVASTAAAAGGAADGKAEKLVKDTNKEKKKSAEKQKSGADEKKTHAEKLADIAKETRAGSWMSDEEKAEAKAHEKQVERVAKKARKRKGFKQTVARVLAVIGLGAMLAGEAGETAQAAEMTTVQETEEGRQMREQAELTAMAAQLGITPAELVQKNLLDFDAVPEQAISDFGASYYEGFMNRENSQELPNGLRANYTLYESKKNSKNSYGPDQSYIYDMAEGREAEAKKKLLEMIRDQPQALASFTANYPRLLKACGVDGAILQEQNLELRSQAVMNLMLGEGGGELQNKLMGAAAMALNNENTSFDFYLENGMERSFYMKKIDPNGPNTPDNIMLKTSKIYRDNVPQVQITLTYVDGIQEYSDQNLKCYFQSNMTVNTYQKRESVIEVRLDPQTEQVAVQEQHTDDEPGGGTPDDGMPDDETDDDGGEDDEDEDVEQKDPDNQKEKVEEGGQTNPVTPDPEDGLKEETDEEEATPSEDNKEQTENGQVGDQTKTEDEVVQDQEGQQDANQNEQTENMTDDDFLDFVESVINEVDADNANVNVVQADQQQPSGQQS